MFMRFVLVALTLFGDYK